MMCEARGEPANTCAADTALAPVVDMGRTSDTIPTPDGGTVTNATTPTYSLDQIADYLTTDYWGGSQIYWQDPDKTLTVNLTGLTIVGQTLARAALAAWSDVANLRFTETTGSAQITFDDNQSGAFANWSSWGTAITSATVNVSTQWLSSQGTTVDSYSYQTYVHEIGHALGLGHAGNYNGSASYGTSNHYANDTWAYTVMSYFSQSESGHGSYRVVNGPQLADIVAIQDLYGAATSRSGDTVYGHNATAGSRYAFSSYSTAPAFSIYDSGGNDRLDASGYNQAQTISLVEESFSSIGGLSKNISIARGTVIENATGGSGADRITGNAGANSLYGNSGHDTLFGGDGADLLDGGVGNDTMDGGDGNDVYYVDSMSDVASETNADVASGGFDYVIATVNISAGANIEQIILRGTATQANGSATADVLYGLESSQRLTLAGGGGNDVLYGSSAGYNVLSGADGIDTLLAHGGNNTLQGGAGNDVYYSYAASNALSEVGGSGIDTVYASHDIVLAAGFEQVILLAGGTTVTGSSDNNIIHTYAAGTATTSYGNGGADVFLGGDFADTFHGGAGVDLMFGYGGANALFGGDDTDIYYLSSGQDTVTETSTGGYDTIYANAAGTTMIASNVEQLILYGAATGAIGNADANNLFGHIASGAVTLDGAAGNDYLLDSAASGDVLIGGAGNDQLDLKTGGNDCVHFASSGSGADVVFAFDADATGGQDLIVLSGRGFSAASIGSAIVIAASGSNTLITIGADTIQLHGVTAANITAADFVF